MGFIAAMVAPRFAGVVGDTVQTVGDTSKNRGAQLISTFYEREGRYPSGLVNLVMAHGDTTIGYQIPYVDNQDPTDGREVLRWNHHNNWKHVIHILNADEAEELRELGITRIYNLNQTGDVLDDPNLSVGDTLVRGSGVSQSATHEGRTGNWASVEVVDQATVRPAMEEVTPAEGLGVAMSMVGHDGDGWYFVSRATPPHSRNDNFGRIVFGLGSESELVTSGMASRSGVTPVATTTENYTWDGYYMILPRLAATSDRLIDENALGGGTNLAGGGVARAPGENLTDSSHGYFGQVVAFGYERQGHHGLGNSDFQVVNPSNLTTRVVNILDPMQPWDFATNPTQHDMRWSMAFDLDPGEL